jgi:hypothetical protein
MGQKFVSDTVCETCTLEKQPFEILNKKDVRIQAVFISQKPYIPVNGWFGFLHNHSQNKMSGYGECSKNHIHWTKIYEECRIPWCNWPDNN